VLRANVEKCLAALKSSTQINGFQRLFFWLHFSEANASGMVSNQINGFQIPESRQNVCSAERIKIVALVCKLQSTERAFLKPAAKRSRSGVA
jgi:hypothetical protein